MVRHWEKAVVPLGWNCAAPKGFLPGQQVRETGLQQGVKRGKAYAGGEGGIPRKS